MIKMKFNKKNQKLHSFNIRDTEIFNSSYLDITSTVYQIYLKLKTVTRLHHSARKGKFTKGSENNRLSVICT